MLYTKPKKEALTIHERAVSKYNLAFQKMEQLGGCLYEKRCDCVTLLREIEFLVTTIANRPKEFDKKISKIQAERESFHKTETYAAEAINAAIKSGISVASGTAGGVAAAKWVATIFGTESTGAAISTLSGATAANAAVHLGGSALADGIALSTLSGTAATNAAVHLGGGALAAGGAGVTGSQAPLVAFLTAAKDHPVLFTFLPDLRVTNMAGVILRIILTGNRNFLCSEMKAVRTLHMKSAGLYFSIYGNGYG